MNKKRNIRKGFLCGIISVLMVSAIVVVAGCKIESDIDSQLKVIEGFSFDNYPKVDGSTSTDPLNVVIACKLLGLKYQWVFGNSWYIKPVLQSKENIKKFDRLVKSSQTHQSILNLIDKEADIILSARTMSPDEKAYADSAGVNLIETPIALDAFVFIVNSRNPVTSLTIKQIQDIYIGKIYNWKEVGGNDARINPYVRNRNSGSQELMELLVMKDLYIPKFPTSWEVVSDMTGAFEHVQGDVDSICYTVYYFKEHMLKNYLAQSIVESIAVEGIYPDEESISNGSYPFVAEVYAVIRSDLDKSSTAYKLYEFLQTEKGKEVIAESGYIPY